MAKLGALGAVKKAWNALRDVAKRRGVVGKLIMKRKKSFGKNFRVMFRHSKPVFRTDACRRSGRFTAKVYRRRFLPPMTVVNRILPRADNRKLMYVSQLLDEGHVQKPESMVPCQKSSCTEVVPSEVSSSNQSPPDEVDMKAEAFISNFHQQMKLQRQKSFGEYHEMLERGIS